jgi:competence protein ComEC
MKRLLGVLALGFVLVALGVPQAAHVVGHLTPTLLAQQDPATITVYVTRTGAKYHRDGCRYLSRSKIATTLKDAVARGFGPCSVCKPPTIAKARN